MDEQEFNAACALYLQMMRDNEGKSHEERLKASMLSSTANINEPIRRNCRIGCYSLKTPPKLHLSAPLRA